MITVADLRALPSLRAYGDDELEMLAMGAAERHFDQDACLCREGNDGQSCFLLVRGEVDVLKRVGPASREAPRPAGAKEGGDGERCIARLGPGSLIGQMALVDQARRSATVRAVSEVAALEIDRTTFQGLLRGKSPLAIRFQEQLAVDGIRQLRRTVERLHDLFDRAREKQRARDALLHGAEERGLDYAYTMLEINEWGVAVQREPGAAMAPGWEDDSAGGG